MPITDYTEHQKNFPVPRDENGVPTMTRILHFVFGDIAVTCDLLDARVLSFEQASEARDIGEFKPATGETFIPPVKMYFDRPESIDVVIGELQKLRDNWSEDRIPRAELIINYGLVQKEQNAIPIEGKSN